MGKSIAFAVFLSCLAGCTPTAYLPAVGAGYGYSEIELSDGTYQVYFEGNQYTPESKAREFALLRSAELTLETGHRYFTVAELADQTRVTSSTSTPMPTTTTECKQKGDKLECVSTTSGLGGGTTTSTYPRYSYTIKMFVEHPEGEALIIYDAATVRRELRTRYADEFAPTEPD